MRIVVMLGDEKWDDGPGWYYHEDDLACEGTVGPFPTWHEALLHAESCGLPVVVVSGGTVAELLDLIEDLRRKGEDRNVTIATLTAERDAALELAAGEGCPVVAVSTLLLACQKVRALTKGENDYAWGWLAGCDATAEAVTEVARQIGAAMVGASMPRPTIAGDVLGGPLAGPGK